LSSSLSLVLAQSEQIKEAYTSQIGEFNSLKWDLDAGQQKLSKLLETAKIDRAKALGEMERLNRLEDKLKRHRLAMLIDIKNLLTKNQQDQLKRLRTSKDMNTPTFHIAAINENPRMVLKVNGNKAGGVEPLMVIIDTEGKKSFVTSIDHISPDNIASVNVLKGDAAISAYGESGENGVVIITMK